MELAACYSEFDPIGDTETVTPVITVPSPKSYSEFDPIGDTET